LGGCGRPFVIASISFAVAASTPSETLPGLLLDGFADFPMMSEGIDDSS
jgi:hypothetical protein